MLVQLVITGVPTKNSALAEWNWKRSDSREPIFQRMNYARAQGQETDIAAKPFVGVRGRFTGVQVSHSRRGLAVVTI
jgi:hypothetical protein